MKVPKKKTSLTFKTKKNPIRRCKLYLRRTHSNIFLTLTDLRNKVIICKTSGQAPELKYATKRRKRAPYAIENIVKALNFYLTLYEWNI